MKEQILKLRSQGLSYNQIVNKLGCSKSTISYHCGKGVKSNYQKRAFENLRDKCKCGNVKLKRSNLCQECTFNKQRKDLLNKPLIYFIKDSKSSSKKFNQIRKYARLFLSESKVDKKCVICGFNVHVEVCHIKAISSFSKYSLLKEVNSLDNLVYLCPNHHYMLDAGLIEL
jgi:transcriptional regulator with XRE-family HTH domain